MDFGRGPSSQQLRGPVAATIAMIGLVGLACSAVLDGSARRALTTWPGRLLIASSAGTALWCALSIGWASGPDLAWIEANHALVGLAALFVGIAFAARGRGRLWSPAGVAVLVSVGCAVPTGWALATKVLPDLPGATSAARLSGTVGLPNVFAVLVVIAIPGAVWLGGRAGTGNVPQWADRAAAVGVALSLCALAFSYSRSGFVALAVALSVMLAFGACRERILAILCAAAAGAIPATVYGLTAHALTTDGLSVGDRRSAGLLLALLLAAGVILAGLLCGWLVGRSRRWKQARVVVASRTVAGILAAGVGVAVVAVLMGGQSDVAIGNDPGRIVSLSTNNRTTWWSEALRGFRDAPLVGNGAGSFRITHLRENALQGVLEPHQLTLQTASELGAVGLLLLAIGMVGVVLAGVAAVRRRGAAEVVPAIAVLAAIGAHTQLDVSWSAPAVIIVGLGLAGTLVGSALPPAARRRPGGALGAAVPLIAAAVVASAALPLGSLVALDRASRALDARKSATAYSRARLAATLNPLDIRSVLVSASAAKLRRDDHARLAAARRAVDRQPENPLSWACLAGAPATAAERRLASENVAKMAPKAPERIQALASC